VWLENIQDWNLSRSRYWGTPLPIWRTEDGKEEKCIGSVKELYDEIEKAGKAGIMASNPLKDKGFNPEDMSLENYNLIDLHRPYVDNIFLVSDSGRKMVRESDLIDVWFDSGAMPYAQEGLRNLGSPDFGATADFIAEGVDQTRGWFYTLHAIHTMISGTPAFKRVISNGLVLDKNGNKMSKRLGNAVDPFWALDTYGADALRWYMLTNAQPWDNLKFDEAGVDEIRRKFFGTLYNTYSFFALYANIDKYDPAAPEVPFAERPEIDRWILSRLNSLVKDVTAAYEDYDLTTAGRLIQDFVCEHLSNWYVRLNRKRFWAGEMTADKKAAYDTLYRALRYVALLGAPIAPFYMDQLWCDLSTSLEMTKEDGDSVHFQLMPKADEALIDRALEERMSLAQTATSLILSLRKGVHIAVRQPLAKVLIPVIDPKVREQLAGVRDLILGETNVKTMDFVEDTSGILTLKIKPNFRTLGKVYGARMKEIAQGFATLDQATIAAIQQAGDYTLNFPGGEVKLTAEDYQISSEDMPGWIVASEGALTVALDVALTPELVQEGIAREVVSRIQNLRKESGFEVTDRIDTVLYSDSEQLASSMAAFGKYVAAQTLSRTLEIKPLAQATAQAAEQEWAEGALKIIVKR
jgi:isoleucyl-tRNA synthetase